MLCCGTFIILQMKQISGPNYNVIIRFLTTPTAKLPPVWKHSAVGFSGSLSTTDCASVRPWGDQSV